MVFLQKKLPRLQKGTPGTYSLLDCVQSDTHTKSHIPCQSPSRTTLEDLEDKIRHSLPVSQTRCSSNADRKPPPKILSTHKLSPPDTHLHAHTLKPPAVWKALLPSHPYERSRAFFPRLHCFAYCRPLLLSAVSDCSLRGRVWEVEKAQWDSLTSSFIPPCSPHRHRLRAWTQSTWPTMRREGGSGTENSECIFICLNFSHVFLLLLFASSLQCFHRPGRLPLARQPTKAATFPSPRLCHPSPVLFPLC